MTTPSSATPRPAAAIQPERSTISAPGRRAAPQPGRRIPGRTARQPQWAGRTVRSSGARGRPAGTAEHPGRGRTAGGTGLGGNGGHEGCRLAMEARAGVLADNTGSASHLEWCASYIVTVAQTPRRKAINKISLQRSSSNTTCPYNYGAVIYVQTPQISTSHPEDHMDWNPRRYLPLLGLTVLAIAFATSACTNTEYVEVEQPRFNPAPDSVAGFLGLYDVPTNQTTCGNCHVNNQTEWTRHPARRAYATLATDRRGRPSCFGCHTVTQNRKHLRSHRRTRRLERGARFGLSQRAVRKLPRPGADPRHQPEHDQHSARERLIPWKTHTGL